MGTLFPLKQNFPPLGTTLMGFGSKYSFIANALPTRKKLSSAWRSSPFPMTTLKREIKIVTLLGNPLYKSSYLRNLIIRDSSSSALIMNPGTESKKNTPAAQEKCITRLLLYHICVNLPLMVLSYPAFTYMGMTSKLPLPSCALCDFPSGVDVKSFIYHNLFRKVVICQIICYFILEDFIFYWGHRILHTKWLYKHVHSVHHEYATPFGLTSEYAHPAEILFLGFATIVGPAITGPHLFTLWLWMILRVMETVEAHCGYDFPWSLSKFLPLYGGADFHDYHHRLLYTKSGNYSSTFTYMDWIFGTDKGYHKLKALKKDCRTDEIIKEPVEACS
eukprot:Gb_29081 [translate_table: standard]